MDEQKQYELDPEDYQIILKIVDLWGNNCSDMEIRETLSIPHDRWEDILKKIKKYGLSVADNRIAYERFLARQYKRSKELEVLRNYAISNDELGTAVKCFQLESDIDRSVIEMGQKLRVLEGEVIKIEKTVTHTSLDKLFATVPPELQGQAVDEMKELAKEIVQNGLLSDMTDE